LAKYNKKRARELKHDRFRDTTMLLVDRLADRIGEYRTQILYGLIGLVVVAIGIYGIIRWRHRNADEAAAAIGRAIAINDADIGPNPPPGSRDPFFTSQQERSEKAIQEFKIENPSASVPQLLEIRKAIARLEPGIWRTRKTQEVDNLIQNCLGLFVEVTSDNYWVSPGERVTSSVEILNRSGVPVRLTAIHSPELLFDTLASATLANNILILSSFLASDPSKPRNSMLVESRK